MAVDPNSLTTLANLKADLGITSATDDAILERFIDRASATVERFLGRPIKSRSVVEWHDTYGADRMVLKITPVTAIRFVGVGEDAALTVGSTTATDATVSVAVSDTAVTLYRMEANGTETTTTLAFASYPTTTDLATAIGATAGFSASALLDRPSRRLRRLAGRDLINATVNLECADESLLDYMADMDRGIIYGRQLSRYRSVLVEYTGGHATVPYDIEQATITLASRLYWARQRDSGVSSESLGGYSYSLRGAAEIDSEMRAMLSAWRTIR
jgi:hydrogenase/urease accessory protein HupE